MDPYGKRYTLTFEEKENQKQTQLHYTKCTAGYFSTNLGLEYLGCGDDQCHKFACLMHSEIICLVQRHIADYQRIIVMAASFGQTHVSFENVQHSLLFSGCNH